MVVGSWTRRDDLLDAPSLLNFVFLALLAEDCTLARALIRTIFMSLNTHRVGEIVPVRCGGFLPLCWVDEPISSFTE